MLEALEATADAFLARRAAADARRAAMMADPVMRFHLRHGQRPTQEAPPCAAAEAGDEEPGPA